MMQLEQRDYSQLFKELEYYPNHCSKLELLAESKQNKITELAAENKQMREKLQSLKRVTSSALRLLRVSMSNRLRQSKQ